MLGARSKDAADELLPTIESDGPKNSEHNIAQSVLPRDSSTYETSLRTRSISKERHFRRIPLNNVSNERDTSVCATRSSSGIVLSDQFGSIPILAYIHKTSTIS